MSRFGLVVYEQPFHTFAWWQKLSRKYVALHITGDMRFAVTSPSAALLWPSALLPNNELTI